MEEFYRQRVFTDFLVDVNVNGSHIRYVGSGEGDAEQGIVNVRVRTEDRIPKGFQTGVLSFTLITGQADISRKGNVTNPFQLSLGAYQAKRTLKIPTHGQLVATYIVTPPEGQRRTANFSITGDIDLPALVSIDPTIETWKPRSNRGCDGRFEMVWNTDKGERIVGVTETVYDFPQPIPSPQLLSRSIQFDLKAAEQELFQSEIIRLYQDTPDQQAIKAELATATR